MILLTGASGFIGKHLLKKLVNSNKKEKVVAFTSKPLNNFEHLLHYNYNFDSNYFIDNNLENITTLIHAGSFIPKSKEFVNDIIGSYSNIHSTTKLLSSDLPNLKKIIFISTVDVYGYDKVVTENTATDPVSMYGISKLYCEKLISTFCEREKIIFQILRIGHVYGPGEENFNKIIPSMLKKVINGENLIQYGDGEDIRSFIFISDVVNSIIKSIELNKSFYPINIVSNEKVKIKNLLKMMISLSKKDIIVKKISNNEESRNLVFNNDKMIRFLTKPTVKLIDGLSIELNSLSADMIN